MALTRQSPSATHSPPPSTMIESQRRTTPRSVGTERRDGRREEPTDHSSRRVRLDVRNGSDVTSTDARAGQSPRSGWAAVTFSSGRSRRRPLDTYSFVFSARPLDTRFKTRVSCTHADARVTSTKTTTTVGGGGVERSRTGLRVRVLQNHTP